MQCVLSHPYQGENYTALETPSAINDVCVVPNSGLFFAANEDAKILIYFIPVWSAI